MENNEEFLKALEFCRVHPQCPGHCPVRKECGGAYDMLYRTFHYVDELTEENKRLRKELGYADDRTDN